MQKVCENCNNTFNTKDPRQKSCGKSCSSILRRLKTRTTVNADSRITRTSVGQLQKLQMELPPPEELPAPYAKRVHDMWATLVGGDSAPTRVA